MDSSLPPTILDLPVGIDASGIRRETDSLGVVEVPADRYWGAQTQRTLQHFPIGVAGGGDRMPPEIHRAFGYLKKAAAIVNTQSGRLPAWMGELIARVCDELLEGQLDDHLPLYVWQAGSGTQTNMNVNEVIANRAVRLTGGELGSRTPVHPNDHVNMCQSSNDTFPTAMHIAAYRLTTGGTIPSLRRLRDAVAEKADRWADVVKIGRTHLQDATPLTVGQEWSGLAAALGDSIDALEHAARGLLRLAMGGTAVGTGINAPPGFDREVAAVLTELTGDPFEAAPNKFAAQATIDDMVRAHAALKGVAVTLYKIANDIRWLGSGPRSGLRELELPANEPGSSIMPGKVNPTQCEAMLMVCMRVIGADTSISLAGAESNLQLNTCRPMVIGEYLHSARILADAAASFREHLVEGLELNEATLRRNVEDSVMLVTALSPLIGYDEAAKIARFAMKNDCSLRQAALEHGVDEVMFDNVVDPLAMTRPGLPD